MISSVTAATPKPAPQAIASSAHEAPIGAPSTLPEFPNISLDISFHIAGKSTSLNELISAYTDKNPGAKVCFVGSGLQIPLSYAKKLNMSDEEIFNLTAGAKEPRDLDFVFIRGENKNVTLVSALCSCLNVAPQDLRPQLNAEFTLVHVPRPKLPLDLVEADRLPHLTTSEGIYYSLSGNKGLFAASGSLKDALTHRARRIAYYHYEEWRHLSGSFKRFIQLQTEGWSLVQAGVLDKLRNDSLRALRIEQIAPILAKRLAHLPEKTGYPLAYACNALFRLREGAIVDVDQVSEALFSRIKSEGSSFEALAREMRCTELVQTFLRVARLLQADPNPHIVITSEGLEGFEELFKSETACRALEDLSDIQPNEEVIARLAPLIEVSQTALKLFYKLSSKEHPQYYEAAAILHVTDYHSDIEVLQKCPRLCMQAVRYYLSQNNPERALRRLLLLRVKDPKLARGVLWKLPEKKRFEVYLSLQNRGYFKGETFLDFRPINPEDELKRVSSVPLKKLRKIPYNTPESLEALEALCHSEQKRAFYLEKLQEFCLIAKRSTLMRLLRKINLKPEAKLLLIALGFPEEESLNYLSKHLDWEVYLSVQTSASFALSERMLEVDSHPSAEASLQHCFTNLNRRFPALALQFAKRFHRHLDVADIALVDDTLVDTLGYPIPLVIKRLHESSVSQALSYLRKVKIDFSKHQALALSLLTKARRHPNKEERIELFNFLTSSKLLPLNLDFATLKGSGLLVEASEVLGDIFGDDLPSIKMWNHLLVSENKTSLLSQRVCKLFFIRIKGKAPLKTRIQNAHCFKKEKGDLTWPYKLLLYKKVISALWKSGHQDAATTLWETLEKPLLPYFTEERKVKVVAEAPQIRGLEILLPLFMTTLTTLYLFYYSFPTK